MEHCFLHIYYLVTSRCSRRCLVTQFTINAGISAADMKKVKDYLPHRSNQVERRPTNSRSSLMSQCFHFDSMRPLSVQNNSRHYSFFTDERCLYCYQFVDQCCNGSTGSSHTAPQYSPSIYTAAGWGNSSLFCCRIGMASARHIIVSSYLGPTVVNTQYRSPGPDTIDTIYCQSVIVEIFSPFEADTMYKCTAA